MKLNSYAYDVAGTYTSSTGILSVSWKLNADAAAIKIVAKDSDGEYVLKEYGATPAYTDNGAVKPYTSNINVLDAVAKGLNVGENISWRIDVYSVNRGGNASIKHEHFTDLPESWSFEFRSPFSVDIDNNPNSPYFGRMYVTQMMWYDKDGNGANDYPRGIYVYGNNLKRIGM